MIELPTPIAAYVAAANNEDAQAVARCFTADAVVHDEGAIQRGRSEIATWAREAAQRYRFRIEPASLTGTAERCRMMATVTGTFPGSPATLRFDFVVRPDGIASLESGA